MRREGVGKIDCKTQPDLLGTLPRASEVSKQAGLSLREACFALFRDGLRPVLSALLATTGAKQFNSSGSGPCGLPWCLACWASHQRTLFLVTDFHLAF